MASIHPTALISDDVKLGDNVDIGPYCVLEGNITIGDNATLKSHVSLAGNTTIGSGLKVYPFASIGNDPQDLKFKGEETKLVIGDNCIIREGVTVNPGTAAGSIETRIGNNCVLLANSHVAHDCVLGDNVILSNGVLIAGHVSIGNHVIMGGGSAVHQFTRIGDHAFIGGLAGIENDVIPFGISLGNRAYLGGINLIGMKRHGIARESIHAVRQVYKDLFLEQDETLQVRLDKLSEELLQDPQVASIVTFIQAASDRSLCVPRTVKE
ncbi:MAG: acyl-ACP--UDP-N-acetylglucosamine O-acyltransferase [Hyphomicrobiales bacterium]